MNRKSYKLKTKQKRMTPMNTPIKFSNALCHPISVPRPTWPRGGFANTAREQLAEIGRAFARGDKRAVDQACEELKAPSRYRVERRHDLLLPIASLQRQRHKSQFQRRQSKD